MLVFGLLALAPSAAVGQFTTFIPRQTKAQDSAKAAVATQQRARADSVTAAHLTNMKTWVDSASGVVVPSTRADSLSRTDSLALPRAAAETSTFRNGSPAPMTASS